MAFYPAYNLLLLLLLLERLHNGGRMAGGAVFTDVVVTLPVDTEEGLHARAFPE